MLRATQAVEATAAAVLRRMKTGRGTVLRDQLVRSRREANAVAQRLDTHDKTLSKFCKELQSEHQALKELNSAFAAAENLRQQSLTATNSAKPKPKGAASRRSARAGRVLPWSTEEDAALVAQVRKSGFAWGVVGAALPAPTNDLGWPTARRTGGQCKERWEALVEEVGRRAREVQQATTKAAAEADRCMREAGSTMVTLRSRVQLATRQMAQQVANGAQFRSKARPPAPPLIFRQPAH